MFNTKLAAIAILSLVAFASTIGTAAAEESIGYLHPSKNTDTRVQKQNPNNPYSAEVTGVKGSDECRIPPAFTEVHESANRNLNSDYTAYGYGTPVSEEAIKPIDISVLGNGDGLPDKSIGMTIVDGEELYLKYCGQCHGEFGEGNGHYLPLAGGPTDISDDGGPAPVKTISNYWPYATTMFDYIRRAMPFFKPNHPDIGDAGYMGITGYILLAAGYTEGKDWALDSDTFFNSELLMKMNDDINNRYGFFCDPRPEAHNIRCGLNGKTCPDHLVGNGKGDIHAYTKARINPITNQPQYNVNQRP